MVDLARTIERYIGSKRKHSFNLKNGREHLGWLDMEYDESGNNVDYTCGYVVFIWAPGPFDEPSDKESEEEKVPLEDIDFNSLYYWDYNTNAGWVKFDPDAAGP